MKKFFQKIKALLGYNFIQHFRDYLKLREAIIMADEQHAKDGDCYYVAPSLNGQLIIMDRKNFRRLKRKHYIPQNATIQHLRRECFYHTPYSDGSYRLSAADRKILAENYYAWAASQRMMKQFNKTKKNESKNNGK